MTRTVCRHCRRRAVNRPRGTCWSCYYTPGVRNLYPSRARRGVGLGNPSASLAVPEPTAAVPGTPEKVAVLEERARLGQRLWHPADAVRDPGAA